MMKAFAPKRLAANRDGFTIVELMITIAIVSILLAFSAGAVFMAQESAREENTRGLITKIDQIIMERYESYRTRRIPISMTAAEMSSATGAHDFAKRKLSCLRELMRMELPDRWSDITDGPVELPNRPALSNAYLRRYTPVASESNLLQYQGAECLYLILKLSGDERAAIITERYAGDKDGDGALEIWDAWGNPISFIRWPAGFLNSTANGYITDLQTGDATTDHDPFDYRKLHSDAFAMYPLIYSSGPDGISDIVSDTDDSDGTAHCDEEATAPGTPAKYMNVFGSSPNNFTNNPLMTFSSRLPGVPADCALPPDGLNHADNIHNHLLGIR